MASRLLLRTHYQAAEPALLSILVRSVLSATKTTYRDSVAEQMHREMTRRSYRMNVAAAGYLFDLARALGLATDKNVLSGRGKALAIVADAHGDSDFLPALNQAEKLAFLTYFLDADAPCLARVAAELLRGPTTRQALVEGGVIQRIFREVVDFYLDRAVDISERTALRNERERLEKDYTGRTPQHKLDVRLTLLTRCGLIEGGQSQPIQARDVAALQSLAELGTDLAKTEAMLDPVGGAIELAGRVLFARKPLAPSGLVSAEELIETYATLSANAGVFVEVSALAELVTFRALERSAFVGFGNTLASLDRLNVASSKSVRFHLDRRGQPAFVAISTERLAV